MKWILILMVITQNGITQVSPAGEYGDEGLCGAAGRAVMEKASNFSTGSHIAYVCTESQ